MQIRSAEWTAARGWSYESDKASFAPDWVLYFGDIELLQQSDGPISQLSAAYPKAICCGCSTSGEILGGRVSDRSIAAVLVTFSRVRVRAVTGILQNPDSSRATARRLAEELQADDLRHVLVLSEGLLVNGTQLAIGFREALPERVAVTGGLAGDGTRFARTVTGLGSQVRSGQVVAVGFYGDGLRVGYGSAGGWESFGPRRMITKSKNNVLYELDGLPALDLYKRYLGERAAGLPATGLLFPLELLPDTLSPSGLVRTILAVDESANSLTFAGDMPEGRYARLMKANHGELLAGAEQAISGAKSRDGGGGTRLAVLVSCVGRRLVLGQRVEEELDSVRKSLRADDVSVGFYSYGEICPPTGMRNCELHNQTMTVTTIAEADDAGS
jgi:hypothetical protein